MALDVVVPGSAGRPFHETADTVVVGSGASGAVVAAWLAQRGERVIVVEEGKHVAPEVYGAMRPSESLRHVWREGAVTAAFGLGDSPVINVTMGKVVGGSSVLTGGVCFRTPDSVLSDWVTRHGLTSFSPAELDPYFGFVEQRSHIEVVPEHMRSHSTVLFSRGAEQLGFSLKPLRRNTRDCNGCGRCNFGCPHGAKLSVDVTFLEDACAAGARIVSRAVVQRVLMDGDRATGVSGYLMDTSGRRTQTFRIDAKRVVVAAGAAHTPGLLAASGLRGRSGQLGRNLTLHPSFRVIAQFDEPVRGWSGALQSAYTDHFDHERLTLVSVFVPPPAIAVGVPGIGPEFMRRVADMPHLAMFGGLIHDEGGGRVLRIPGREPLMLYRMAREDRAAMPGIVRRLSEVFFAAGARRVFLPILGHPPVERDQLAGLDLERYPARQYECSSQHPLGTARMGTDPARSVVDPDLRVWGTKNLFVVDGGTLPTSLGVNPQLTIMALAHRAAVRMTRD